MKDSDDYQKNNFSACDQEMEDFDMCSCCSRTEESKSQVVKNVFFGSDDDSNTLPDLVKKRSPLYIVIDSSSDDNVVPIVVCQVSGPQHVSSPARHMCVCDWPSLSPINAAPRTTNRDECVIIADSTTM